MSAEIVYLDSSAVVKLVVEEPESTKLRRWLRRRTGLVSSALARVEVSRAVRVLGDPARRRSDAALRRIELVRITDEILEIASDLEPPTLRSLDAIHVATASLFAEQLGHVVTYDLRMADAARRQGWDVVAPS